MSDGPSSKEMFLSFTDALKNSFELLKAKGVLFASEEIFHKRIDICSSCEHLFSTAGINRCKICGCGLNLKVRLASTCCPIGKWHTMTQEEIAAAKLKN